MKVSGKEGEDIKPVVCCVTLLTSTHIHTRMERDDGANGTCKQPDALWLSYFPSRSLSKVFQRAFFVLANAVRCISAKKLMSCESAKTYFCII